MSIVLTLETTVSFINNPESIDLSIFESIEDDAAESLSRHEGDLDLDALQTLTDAAAESLGKHNGSLYLNSLTSLSYKAAESLGKHNGELYLNGLSSLSDAAAGVLSKHHDLSVSEEIEMKIDSYRKIKMEELINDEFINSTRFFEIHLRSGGADYAGCGYYYIIGYAFMTPSWDVIKSLIEYTNPDTQNSANPVHPFYLDLRGKSLKSELYGDTLNGLNIFSDNSVEKEKDIFLNLFHRFSKEKISLVLSKLNDGYVLIYEGLTFDDSEEIKNGLLTLNNKILVIKWDGELEYI
jgi:hypothetical protein